MTTRSFRLLDHPADIGVEARGETLAEAFTAAAEGLLSIIGVEAPRRGGASRRLSLSAPDECRLLVRWLSEILYLFDAEGCVPSAIKITAISETSLEAEISLERCDPAGHRAGTDVKAVTYHDLMVHRGPGGITLTVYFDV